MHRGSMEGKATKLGGHDIAERKLCLPLLLERNRADELSARLLHAVHRTRLRRCKGGGEMCACVQEGAICRPWNLVECAHLG